MRVIAEDLQFPEGPVWVGDGSLLVVEIRRRTLTRIWPDSGKRRYYEIGGGPNGAAMGPDGCAYVANNGGFAFRQRADGLWVSAGQSDDYQTGRIDRVDLETGKWEVLYDRCGKEPIRGPNDIVFDAHGGFYFTDPGKTRHRDWDRGCVCYGKADGSMIRELFFPIHKPNGIGISPDGRTLYVAETESTRLYAWDIVGPGELAVPKDATPRPPHNGRLVYGSTTYARFDSLAVEENGFVCIATLDTGGITVIDPAKAAAGFVPVPGDSHCTNICFGGPGMRKAYVTQSHVGRLVEIDWPRPGLRLEH